MQEGGSQEMNFSNFQESSDKNLKLHLGLAELIFQAVILILLI